MEQSRIHLFCGIALGQALQAVRMGIDWNRRVFGQNLKPFHVVNMVVRDENGLDISDSQVIFSQPSQDLLRTDAHIHQNAFVLLAHIVAIAAAARGKAAKHKGGKAGEKIHLSQIWPQK